MSSAKIIDIGTVQESYQNIRLAIDEHGVATALLDVEGAKVNLLAPKLSDDFARLLERVETDTTIKALVIGSAKDDSFVLGADVQILQNIRDEAHRFAISYYAKVHRKKTFTSVLDNIPGIGPRRKSALMHHFGSVPRIQEASIDELMAATGMTHDQAKKVKEHL